MAIGRAEDIASDVVVHRVGGAAVENLRLSALEKTLTPPGISVLLGGTPEDAANQMRAAFPRSKKWNRSGHTVGTSTAAAIRAAGFEIVPDATDRFPNHARLIHAEGVAGFSDHNLTRLAAAFGNTKGC